MNKFVLAMMATSSLSLLGAPAFAMDHHMAGEAAAPTHEDCMALHQQLMADVAEGDAAARDAVLAGLDAETRARADACHAMMGEMHHADGAADAHANHHEMPAEPAADAHANHHEMPAEPAADAHADHQEIPAEPAADAHADHDADQPN